MKCSTCSYPWHWGRVEHRRISVTDHSWCSWRWRNAYHCIQYLRCIAGHLLLSLNPFSQLLLHPCQSLNQIFDHCAIYLLIAGTYTPYCLVVIKGNAGSFLELFGPWQSLVWFTNASLGKFQNYPRWSTWSWAGFLRPRFQAAFLRPWCPRFHAISIGRSCFTLGAVIYSFKGIKFGHVIWHLFVLLGTILMYFSILLYA